ncbi:cyclodeaminase/cyclohydrolase family protein [Candidatus Desulforudis audaxviator]|uniref:Formiminotransferase-cyclodeaminase n=1 Tax=Desulforudis audaxviator (strain MP104C) TaxID=477974 RepID=B1I3J2_DESAP|nr:cyclodeaminase/cyclohydrolase family protein [Candidatus Desulforudis audaxviator]ACA59535.1 Formiminotransferase-cyclodeaminase [Candidatus Desulforudis audaxviator MP104C]AZK59518.1 Formiminotetrahydrofolate cyclodeaminase [Candidatus Desulforudis audaxviator]
MDYREWSLGEFLERAGSGDPTPGGGSAAAVAGALGAAMAAMVAELTLGRARYRDVEPEVRALLKEAGGLRRELETLASEDSTAFARLLETYRMAQNTDQEQEERRMAIQAALSQAAEVPLEVARAGLETLRLAERLAAIGNEQALSDAGVAAYLAAASVRSALMNVLINARQIEERALVERLVRETKRLGDQAAEVEKLVERTVVRRLGLAMGRNGGK